MSRFLLKPSVRCQRGCITRGPQGASVCISAAPQAHSFKQNCSECKVLSNMTSFSLINYPGGLAYGTSLAPGAVESIITDVVIKYKKAPYSPKAVYLVILGSELTESVHTDFKICNDYCGYHSFLTTTLGKIYYAAVGMPLKCPACIPIGLQTASVNANNSALDGSLSVMAHEL
jgi:hypothetical protein